MSIPVVHSGKYAHSGPFRLKVISFVYIAAEISLSDLFQPMSRYQVILNALTVYCNTELFTVSFFVFIFLCLLSPQTESIN